VKVMLLEYAASLIPSMEAFTAPKIETFVIGITLRHKQMQGKDLNSEWKFKGNRGREITGKLEVQNNA